MKECSTRLESLMVKLRNRGHRLTPQRLVILKILADNTEHLSAEQVYSRVSGDFPTTTLATVYKTVAILKEMGELLELGFGDSGNRYDVRDARPHPHLICVRCKKIEDLNDDRMKVMAQTVTDTTGYLLEHYRLDFFGICPDCRKKGEGI